MSALAREEERRLRDMLRGKAKEIEEIVDDHERRIGRLEERVWGHRRLRRGRG